MAENGTVSIPQKQKAAIYDQPGTISTRVVEIDVPEPGNGEILINLLVSMCPVLVHLYCNR
jgi:propanol-preferring alcohol dehydrogenase